MSEEKKMKYKMELTEEQYQHIIECVETVHRIACGQIDSIREILPIAPDDELLRKIKEQSFPELERGEWYKWDGGYRNDAHGEDFRKAFDLFQARGYQIYRQMEYVRNTAKGIDNVLSSPTPTTDKAKQPIIEAVEE